MNKILQIFSLVAIITSQATNCESYRQGKTQNEIPDSVEDNQNFPFAAISGWIDDASDGVPDRLNPQLPLRHHVDFDHLHPGEDQIAEENTITEPEALLFPPNSPVERQRQSNDELPLSLPVVPLPSFNVDPEREFAHPFLNVQSLLNLLRGRTISSTPWYKSSNVCIKREEEDEIVGGDNSDSLQSSHTEIQPTRAASVEENYEAVYIDNSMQGYPKDQPFFSEQGTFNETESSPEWHMKMSYCRDQDTRHSCYMTLFGPNIRRTITVVYECCHGYELDADKNRCVRTRYENVAKTMEELGGKEFLNLVQNTGLLDKIKRENITVFVPSNDAVTTYLTSHAVYSNDINFALGAEGRRRKRGIIFHRQNNPQGRGVRRHNFEHYNRHDSENSWPQQSNEDFDMNDIDWKQNALTQHEAHKRNFGYEHEDNLSKLQKALLSHMIQGKITTDDFVDEKVIFSENQDSVLRMNTWNVGNEEVKTINCARLVSINHRCSNGMIHMIDRMFKPVSKSIADVIRTDPELSLLNTLLISSGMMEMFSDKSQNLTFFAPTNNAINKLGHTMLHKMQHGDPCLKRILRHHIVPITFCSCIVYKQGQIRNIDHDILDIVRDEDDKLYINGSQVLVRDVMTTNGVLHVIDTVLISENDQPTTKALEKDGYTHFTDALRTAGLEDYIDGLNNITLFVPSNEAMEELGQDILRDSSKLREILLYHIITPESKLCSFSNDQTLSTMLLDRNIRINMYTHFPVDLVTTVTAQCGKITRSNRMTCNGVIHQVDRVLLPAKLDTIETLNTQQDFSIFYRLLVQSDLIDTLKLANSTATIFVPTDSAFYDLPRDVFRAILENKENATRVVKNHIIKEPLCCAGVAPNNWFMNRRVDCLNGAKIPVYRDVSGQVMYGNAKVTTCDLTAANGIIHTVDKVITASNDPSRGDLMEACLPGPLDSIRSATFFIRL